jgi:hypothetical protein
MIRGKRLSFRVTTSDSLSFVFRNPRSPCCPCRPLEVLQSKVIQSIAYDLNVPLTWPQLGCRLHR